MKLDFFSSSTKGTQLFFVISIVSTIIGIFLYDITLYTILLVLLGYFLYGCLGVVVTFHRLHTHNSYKTHKLLSNLFSILGCFAGTGSPIAWVAIHINHHLKSDKKDDPHSPWFKGYKIFALNYEHAIDSNTKWRMRHIITDKFQQFIHRFYFLILLTYSILLYIIGNFWLVIFLFLAPSVITVLMSNIINYVGHKPNWLGSFRTYNLVDKSANNWILAIPSWGEAWHNNHHRFPKRYYFNNKWYQIDISGLIIKIIKI